MYSNANLMSKILEISEKSYYRWKNKDHVVLLNLLEKYFTKDDLKEFLETGKIEKFEKVENFELEAKKVADRFFFDSYSGLPINRNFANVIFPKFEIFIKNKKLEKDNPESEYYNIHSLISFIISEELDFDKTQLIHAVLPLTDFEVYLLITVYAQFK